MCDTLLHELTIHQSEQKNIPTKSQMQIELSESEYTVDFGAC